MTAEGIVSIITASGAAACSIIAAWKAGSAQTAAKKAADATDLHTQAVEHLIELSTQPKPRIQT